MANSIFPKPLIIERTAISSNGTASGSITSAAAPLSANLMPFTIDYNGPAPISRYMLLRPAQVPVSDASEEISADSEQQQSTPSTPGLLESSFRGRTMYGTTISLPPGYEALLVTLPSESDELATLGGGAAQDKDDDQDRKRARVQPQEVKPEPSSNGLRRSPRKKAPPAPPKPAFMPSFSMDEDDDDQDEDTRDAQEPETPMAWDLASPQEEQGEGEESSDVLQNQAEAVRIGKVVGSFGSSITLWNPDGPIDEGDDPYVKTLREWMGVVGKAIHDE